MWVSNSTSTRDWPMTIGHDILKQMPALGQPQDLSRCEDLGIRADAPHLHLYTAVVWHKTLKRRLRLVVLLHRKDSAKPRFIVLGSTDPELNGHKLLDLYAACFQIEFLFRDSKQFTGLLDCQARAAVALDFHL